MYLSKPLFIAMSRKHELLSSSLGRTCKISVEAQRVEKKTDITQFDNNIIQFRALAPQKIARRVFIYKRGDHIILSKRRFHVTRKLAFVT